MARRAGSLTPSGQWAAFVVGTLASVAGWRWAGLLIGYFISSSALTRLGRDVKAARTVSALPESDGRTATQVWANGGVFAILLVLGTIGGPPVLRLMGIGALAAAAADTWATEIGLLWGGAPRSILGFGRLEPGLSGGITVAGSLASALAAAVVALAGAALLAPPAPGLERTVLALFVGGLAGSIADSVLGAALQSKRWCEQCRTWTERRVHTCQYRTQHARGVRWMTNDAVNLLATLIGALAALVAAMPTS